MSSKVLLIVPAHDGLLDFLGFRLALFQLKRRSLVIVKDFTLPLAVSSVQRMRHLS